MKQLFLLPVIGYQKFISPFFIPRCKYYPSCSIYAELAISEFGVKGIFMASWRLIRCNPFSYGGVDYPSQKAVLKISQRQNA